MKLPLALYDWYFFLYICSECEIEKVFRLVFPRQSIEPAKPIDWLFLYICSNTLAKPLNNTH